MPDLRIIIGASADRSISEVFGSIEKRAQKAGQNIAKAMSAGMSGNVGGGNSGNAFNKMSKDADKAANDAIKAVERQKKEVSKAVKEMQRDWEKADNERVKSAEKADKAVIASRKAAASANRAELKQQERDEEQASKSTERFARRASRYALRSGGQMFSAAGRLGMDMARGAGVDLSVGSLVQRTVGIESAAVGLSSRGHIEGAKGANGQVVASGALESEARKAGLATAVNPEEILGAGRAFVGLTGDLDLWRKIMPQVVKQTAALGGNQEDAARAAGEFAAHVGDVPNKEQEVMHLMAAAAGQGKIGGVDFSDFAKYAANAAAPAGRFEGNKGENISKLMALGEISKMHGGSRDPAIAFGSIMQLANALQKQSNFKAIKKITGNEFGQYTDKNFSKFRDVNQVLKDIIWGAAKDAKGNHGQANLMTIGKELGDVRASKAVMGLVDTFNEAGGGAKGMEAVTAELKKFDGAVMSSTEIERANAAQLATTKSQTEIFNQQLESVSHGVMAELGPAMQALAPTAIRAASGLGSVAEWAVKNPMEAVGVGIGLSITKGLAESGMRSAMEGLATKAATASLALGGVAVVALALKELIDQDIDADIKMQNKAAMGDARAGELESRATIDALHKGTVTSDDKSGLEQIDANVADRIHRAEVVKQFDKANGGAPTGLALANEQLWNPERGMARQDANHLTELKEELAHNKRILDLIRTGVLKVELMNPESIKMDGGGPHVNPTSRGRDPNGAPGRHP